LLLSTNSLVSLVGCNWRFHPAVRSIKRWLHDQAIGEVLFGRLWFGSYLPGWVPNRPYQGSYVVDTGVLLDVGSHAVDLIQDLVGSAVLQGVQVRPATSLGLACDGQADLLLAHSAGVTSNVHVNFVQRQQEVGLTLVGSEGTIRWCGEENHVVWLGHGGDAVPFCASYDGEAAVEAMYRDEMAHFLECCREGKASCNPIEQAVKTLRLLLEAKNGAQ